MTFLDFLFAIPICWLAYKGFTKGFIMELFSLGAILIGIYACIHFTDWTSEWLKKTFTESWATMSLCVYLVTFCGAFAAVFFSGKLVEKLISAGGMGLFNKLAGGFFGAIKGAVIVSSLLMAINSINVKKEFVSGETREKSYLYEPLSTFGFWMMPAFNNSDWINKYL